MSEDKKDEDDLCGDRCLISDCFVLVQPFSIWAGQWAVAIRDCVHEGTTHTAESAGRYVDCIVNVLFRRQIPIVA